MSGRTSPCAVSRNAFAIWSRTPLVVITGFRASTTFSRSGCSACACLRFSRVRETLRGSKAFLYDSMNSLMILLPRSLRADIGVTLNRAQDCLVRPARKRHRDLRRDDKMGRVLQFERRLGVAHRACVRADYIDSLFATRNLRRVGRAPSRAPASRAGPRGRGRIPGQRHVPT